MPALFVAEDAFSLASYWDRRYERGTTGGEVDTASTAPPPEEWYRSDRDEATAAVVAAHLDARLPVLQLGVGTSRLQEAMARGFADDDDDEDGDVDDGEQQGGGECFASVLSVDFSGVAIARQQARLDELLRQGGRRAAWASRLSYARGDDADEAAARCLGEAWRVLAPGAAYVMITSAAPAARRRLLPTAEGSGGDGDGASSATAVADSATTFPVWAGVLVYRLGQQGALCGPVALGDSGGEAALLAAHEEDDRFRYSHYAFVCVKA
jgi:hypothetical protein